MDTKEAQIYATLLRTRDEISEAYRDNLRVLAQIKAPTEAIDMLNEETNRVLEELDRRIREHPLHRTY